MWFEGERLRRGVVGWLGVEGVVSENRGVDIFGSLSASVAGMQRGWGY